VTWGRARRWWCASSAAIALVSVCVACREGNDRASSRDERRGEREILFSRIAREKGVSVDVAEALKRVPRHRFVPEASRGEAYADRPLPIGYGQTISQPSVVALMTNAVRPRPTDRCLEIGTGSGYQTAVLAELCRQVYSIEIMDVLAERAEQVLRREGYGSGRLELRTGDGFRGWPEAAPFDVILVTAAPRELPAPLAEQLAVGGRLVIPLGEEGEPQRVTWFRRVRPGPLGTKDVFEELEVTGARFVPLVGEARER
jgi:protein-L-isoaspartate(D-aspartate) O-methyltransferase